MLMQTPVMFAVEALPRELTSAARTTMRSPQYGHPAHAETARGYGPCRSCLRQFVINAERRLLFTCNPFDGLDAYPSPGPVFVHEQECDPWEGDGFPPELRTIPLVFEGYGASRECIAIERPEEDGIEDAIDMILSNANVRYIHIRNAEAGCYIARIVRKES
jgi:hypothetical protein